MLVASLGALLLLSVSPRSASAEGERDLRRNQIVKTVERAQRAIVSIRTNQMVTRTWYDIWNRPQRIAPYERHGGLGSGAIFHPDGYVMTNAHVISRASKIFVGIPVVDKDGGNGTSRERVALPLAIDIENDLAILRLLPDPTRPNEKYPYIALGRSNDLMVGETILALGHPFRLGLTVTTGIVSGLNRKLELGTRKFDDFMQVDAAINPGNSGGPLLDVTGRWIGVNTAIYNRASGAEGIGFAIPADRVRALVSKAFKRRVVAGDWIGVEFGADEQGAAIVERVYPKGPAVTTDLRPKDRIVAVNGTATPTLFDLRIAMVAVRGTQAISLLISRDGRVRRGSPIRVPLRSVPTDKLSLAHLGLVAQDTGESNGVIVVSVREGGPAERMKLRPKDLIQGLGPYTIENTEDLLMFLQFVQSGDLVNVKIRRPVNSQFAKPYTGSLRAE